MSQFAFVFPEAEITVVPAGTTLQVLAYATGMTIDKTAVPLEDGSTAFNRVRLTIDSVWVDDSLASVSQSSGPHKVFVTWRNEDDGRLRSEGIQNATLSAVSGRGSIEGGAQTWTLTFDGLSRL